MTNNSNLLAHISSELLSASRQNNHCGYDPFDGLNSKLFTGLQFHRSELLRLAWLQLHKRLPINLRPLAGVPRKRNPKGIALVISGLLEDYQRTGQQGFLVEAVRLGDWLLANTSDRQEWKYTCWGYHFPWQARAFYVPVGKPNIITTCYAARALFSLAEVTSDHRYLDAAIDAGRFIGSLFLERGGRSYFVYIPGESTFVHNASLWGAAVAAQAGSELKKLGFDDEGLLEKARKAVEQSAGEQADDGSWVYGERSHHQFIDGFHTGYNLEAIWWYQQHTGDNRFGTVLEKGLNYYRRHFFLEDGTPKYYNNAVYPVDMHSVAQAVFTLLRIGGSSQDMAIVNKVLDWSVQHMYLPRKAAFRYQKHRYFNNNVNYMRWTQAWMYYALAFYNHQMAVLDKSLSITKQGGVHEEVELS